MSKSFLFLALALFTIACHAGNGCSTFADDSRLASALKSFFGKTNVSWFWSNGSAADEALAGVQLSDVLQYLDNDHTFMSGCRPHSCTDKVAIVSDCQGTLLTIGI